MIRTLPKTRHVPAAAVKVADKHSDAVVYVYRAAGGDPAAIGYHGKAAKADFWLRFRSQARLEAHVREYFANRQAYARMIAERTRKASQPHKLEVGHVLVASWGYEQTNIDWFQVTRVISATMVEVRPIAADTEDTAWAQGRCIPKIDAFTGEASRHRVTNGEWVKINESVRAHLWDGRPRSWSSYH